jgi:hypothetical protein
VSATVSIALSATFPTTGTIERTAPVTRSGTVTALVSTQPLAPNKTTVSKHNTFLFITYIPFIVFYPMPTTLGSLEHSGKLIRVFALVVTYHVREILRKPALGLSETL